MTIPNAVMQSRSSFKDENSTGSIYLECSEFMRWGFTMAQEVIVGSAAERAIIVKSPSHRVWPEAKTTPVVMLSLMTRQSIDPFIDDTVELSMKAPMSVSKPADLG